jgi:hypothetical protein
MQSGILSPWRLIDAIELRHLRRRLPNAHRAWSRASGKLRPESNTEYLMRLRILAREREALRNQRRSPRGEDGGNTLNGSANVSLPSGSSVP